MRLTVRGVLMKKQYKVAVLIGRFECPHNMHKELFRRAAEIADNVLIIVGSSLQPRTFKNPWVYSERAKLISQIVSDSRSEGEIPNSVGFIIEPNYDTVYSNDAWLSRVQGIVSRNFPKETNIAIIGHKKDRSSFYLDMFPQWDLIEVPHITALNAADIRKLYFQNNLNMEYLRSVVPPSVFSFLDTFKNTAEFLHILQEREYADKYKKPYSQLPFPVTHCTADAVVVQSGHLLMVQRKAEPGKGLWAFPGGFFDAEHDFDFRETVLRELREETRLKVPKKVLQGSIVNEHIFSAIDRSCRGRVITVAHHIVLEDGPLPAVKARSDAKKAEWVPFSEIRSSKCFEDHFEIAEYFNRGALSQAVELALPENSAYYC